MKIVQVDRVIRDLAPICRLKRRGTRLDLKNQDRMPGEQNDTRPVPETEHRIFEQDMPIVGIPYGGQCRPEEIDGRFPRAQLLGLVQAKMPDLR